VYLFSVLFPETCWQFIFAYKRLFDIMFE